MLCRPQSHKSTAKPDPCTGLDCRGHDACCQCILQQGGQDNAAQHNKEALSKVFVNAWSHDIQVGKAVSVLQAWVGLPHQSLGAGKQALLGP